MKGSIDILPDEDGEVDLIHSIIESHFSHKRIDKINSFLKWLPEENNTRYNICALRASSRAKNMLSNWDGLLDITRKQMYDDGLSEDIIRKRLRGLKHTYDKN